MHRKQDDDNSSPERDPIVVAMRKAVAEAIAQHKRDGDPIVVWENGQVRWIPAEEIDLGSNH